MRSGGMPLTIFVASIGKPYGPSDLFFNANGLRRLSLILQKMPVLRGNRDMQQELEAL